MKIEEIATNLGFKLLTGNIWQHKSVGIITIDNDTDVNDLVEKIYNRGFYECQESIKKALGFKQIR